MKYRRKPMVVEPVQWFPDEIHGYFVGSVYRHQSTGYDTHGVEYTICEVGLRTGQGFMLIKPGDWIVTGADGKRWVVEGESFPELYEPFTYL